MRSTDGLLLLELPKIERETCQQMTPLAVFCAERSQTKLQPSLEVG